MGAVAVSYRAELIKLAAQKRTWLGVATAVIGPVIYLLLAIAQGYPEAPLADNLGHTGVGFALVVFKLIVVIGPAVIVALVAGDVVAAEDADGTLKTILTRSVRRSHVLGGKVLALFTYVAFAMLAFFVVATVAAVIAWGFHPLIDLSGARLSPWHALALDVAAVLVYLLPVLAIASFGLFLSVATRQSVAAVGGTLIYAMALQGIAVIAAIKGAHPYLLTNQLTAWHGLFRSPFGGAVIVRAAWVSAAFAVPPLIAAFVVFNRRDVTS